MRFDVEERGDFEKYYAVIDTQHDRWNTYHTAISFYFSTAAKAQEIAVLLNQEWSRFLKNPS